MDSQEGGGGGKTTLYIVIFFLCVISAVAGYFQFSMSSQQAEAEQKMKDIQAKAAADLTAAKSDEEKREIQRQADLDLERAKIKMESETEKAKLAAQTDAEKKALAEREAKIKAAEAAVDNKLKDAAATVKNAQNLQNQAKKAKADADKKNAAAATELAKAIASGKEVDKKLADEKKKLADAAAKELKAAQNTAKKAIKKAKAQAKKALKLKAQLDKVSKISRNPNVSNRSQEMEKLVRQFPHQYRKVDYPGNNVFENVFQGSDINREEVAFACLSQCADMGNECKGIVINSKGDRCWGKREFGRPVRDADRFVAAKVLPELAMDESERDERISTSRAAVDQLIRTHYPAIARSTDYSGGVDAFERTFDNNISRDEYTLTCLNDCVNMGEGCLGVVLSSEGKRCWGKREFGDPVKNDDRVTAAKVDLKLL